MTQDEPNKGAIGASKKEADRYTGMADIDFAMSPSVVICAAAGAALGAMLAMWATSDIPIAFAATIVFGVLSGIFGLFVPWYKPK
jgi:hypothetical protein